MIYVLILISVIFGASLILSIILNIRFSSMLFRFEENIDDCLDELDNQYSIMFKILQRPIFYDSPEIKQVINSIKKCRETILSIASKVSNLDTKEKENIPESKN